MKLEHLKSEKFRALERNQMAKLYGGIVLETNGGHVPIGNDNNAVEYTKDRKTHDDKTGKFIKDEYLIKQNGQWIWYELPIS